MKCNRQSSFRIILDTNTLLRSLIASESASARVRRAAEARLFVTLVSKPVIDEYRAVLSDRQLRKLYPEITTELIEVTIRRLRYEGDYLRTPAAKFNYRRDPDDAKSIELAIESQATHILTYDKDLLSLPRGIRATPGEGSDNDCQSWK